jgi:hypothetical protein
VSVREESLSCSWRRIVVQYTIMFGFGCVVQIGDRKGEETSRRKVREGGSVGNTRLDPTRSMVLF